jgi:hypothetical protein
MHMKFMSLSWSHILELVALVMICVREDYLTGTLHNTKVELWRPTLVNSFSSICYTDRVTIATNNKFSDLILLFRQLIFPLFLATVIVLLIYIINAYMILDNACSELTSTEGQWNDQKKKRTNNDITQPSKEQVTGTLHNTKVELWWPTLVNSFSSICYTGRVTIATNNSEGPLRGKFDDTINNFNVSIVNWLFICLCMCQHSSSTCIWSLCHRQHHKAYLLIGIIYIAKP